MIECVPSVDTNELPKVSPESFNVKKPANETNSCGSWDIAAVLSSVSNVSSSGTVQFCKIAIYLR